MTNLFEKRYYIVARIDGDYAMLKLEGAPEDLELKQVARALLPPDIMEGSRLCYEMMQYTLLY